jgi:hypothetical protein
MAKPNPNPPPPLLLFVQPIVRFNKYLHTSPQWWEYRLPHLTPHISQSYFPHFKCQRTTINSSNKHREITLAERWHLPKRSQHRQKARCRRLGMRASAHGRRRYPTPR